MTVHETAAVRCVAYLRISDMDADPYAADSQTDLENKLAHQQEWVKAEAVRRGWQLVAVYKERHTGTVIHRPELDRLRAEIAAQGVTKVLVYSTDRLGRDDIVTRTLVDEFDAMGVEVVFGSVSLTGMPPWQRKLVLGIMALFAAVERDIIVDRLSRGAARAKEEGTLFSEIPNHFVQDAVGIIRPTEAALDMYERSVRGETYSDIARVYKTYRRDVSRTVERVTKWKALPLGIVWRRGKKVRRALRGET